MKEASLFFWIDQYRILSLYLMIVSSDYYFKALLGVLSRAFRVNAKFTITKTSFTGNKQPYSGALSIGSFCYTVLSYKIKSPKRGSLIFFMDLKQSILEY